MGLTSGAIIDMVKVSPLGDPVEYRLRGYHLTLRKSEASTILVELVNEIPVPQLSHARNHTTLPLIHYKAGQRVKIVRIRGGRRMRQRLSALGIEVGVEGLIICNDFPGPMILSLDDDQRLEIGKRMALHILADPIQTKV
jgi:Fe2+ transport system protein FeoA